MGELDTSTRVACIRENRENELFALAVKPPLDDVSSELFQGLSAQARAVRETEEGSQVFFFDYQRFGRQESQQAKKFQNAARGVLNILAQSDDGVWFDPKLSDTSERIQPNPIELITASRQGPMSRFNKHVQELLDIQVAADDNNA